MTSPERQGRARETENPLASNLSLTVDRLVETQGADAAQSALLGEFLRVAGEHGLGPDVQALLNRISNSYATQREAAIQATEAVDESLPHSSHETTLGASALGGIREAKSTSETHNEDQELEKEIDAIAQSVRTTGLAGKFVNGIHINAVNEQVGPIDAEAGGYSDYQGYGKLGQSVWQIYSKPLAGIIMELGKGQHSPAFPLLTFIPLSYRGEQSVMVSYSLYNNTVDAIGRDTHFSTISAMLPAGESPAHLEKLVRSNPDALPMFLTKIADGFKELKAQGFPDAISLVGASDGGKIGKALSTYERDRKGSQDSRPLAQSAYETIRNLITEVPVTSS